MWKGVLVLTRKKYIDPERFKNLYWKQNMNMTQIAEIFGVSTRTLRKRCSELGIKRRKFAEHMSNIQKVFYSNIENRARFWKKNPKRTRTPQGYIVICVHGKQQYEHRYVMEQALSRELETFEVIHHLNGVRSDNRIENLVLVNHHIHEHGTFIRLLQERIRVLEIKFNEWTKK